MFAVLYIPLSFDISVYEILVVKSFLVIVRFKLEDIILICGVLKCPAVVLLDNTKNYFP